MEEAARALHGFFSGFGLAAYPQQSVPETAGEDEGRLPYIVYPAASPGFGETQTCTVYVFARSEGYEAAAKTADAILAAVGTGVLLRAGEGYVCLRPGDGTAFEAQEDRGIKCARVGLLLTGYGG